MEKSLFAYVPFVAACVLTACGSTEALPHNDAGGEAGADVPMLRDSAADNLVTHDVALDLLPGVDRPADSAPKTDAQLDGPASKDTHADSPVGDAAGPDAPTTACVPNAYVGDRRWTNVFDVGPTATYCSSNSDFYDLKGHRARKHKLVIAPGRHPLPHTPGKAPFALPICVTGASQMVAGTTGEITYATQSLGNDTTHQYTLLQPLADGRALVITFARTTRSKTAPAFTMDGSMKDFGTENGFFTILCPGTGDPNCQADATFTSCTMADVPAGYDKIVFEGGNIDFELKHSAPPGFGTQATDMSVFLSATGKLGATPFTQRNFFKLVYAPGRHHLIRSYAALFDASINGACGIELDKMEYLDKLVAKNAYTVDCNLNRLAPLRVISAVHTGAP